MSRPLDRDRIVADFRRAVNMGAGELAEWLETEESRSVGFMKGGAGESVGHASGRRIVRLLGQSDYDEDDLRHMRKVVGFVARHRAQQPADPVHSRWRRSLMNWGHDPLKDGLG